MTETNDEKVLARAKEIQAERGGSLTDAMILAENELSPKPTLPESFTVTIDVKPRVARWVMSEFTATSTHSTEDRLGVYLSGVLKRARVSAIRMAEDAPDIIEGSAVTMRREQFQKKAEG